MKEEDNNNFKSLESFELQKNEISKSFIPFYKKQYFIILVILILIIILLI